VSQTRPSAPTPETFTRPQFSEALLTADMAVTDAAADSMTTRIFAAAAGLPLTGTLEPLDTAQLTQKSIAAVLLMAGFAPDKPVAAQLSATLWPVLHGEPVPDVAVPVSAAPATDKRGLPLPGAGRELNPNVLADTSTTFTNPGYMIQVMATCVLDQMRRGVRGGVVRQFHIDGFRLSIRASSRADTAVIRIYTPTNPSKPRLCRTCSLNELWQFACPADIGALSKIARGMLDNAAMPIIEDGRAGTDEYARGVHYTEEGRAAPGDPNDDGAPADPHDADDDDEPTISQFLAQAKKASSKNRQQ
jgi:hypothetical protein